VLPGPDQESHQPPCHAGYPQEEAMRDISLGQFAELEGWSE
jgi:hypothetical protein